MGTGVDPAFERTVQVFDITGDSSLLTAPEDPTLIALPNGFVPPGQNWLLERISVRYRPGEVPAAGDFVYLRVLANGTGALDLREGTQIAPAGGFVAGTRYDLFADEASPVRFYSNEQILVAAPTFGSAVNKARLTVVLQIRAVEQIAGAGESDTTDVEPVAEAEVAEPKEPTWG